MKMMIFNDSNYEKAYKGKIIYLDKIRRQKEINDNLEFVSGILKERFNLDSLRTTYDNTKNILVFELTIKGIQFEFGFPFSRFDGELDSFNRNVLATEVCNSIINSWNMILIKPVQEVQ